MIFCTVLPKLHRILLYSFIILLQKSIYRSSVKLQVQYHPCTILPMPHVQYSMCNITITNLPYSMWNIPFTIFHVQYHPGTILASLCSPTFCLLPSWPPAISGWEGQYNHHHHYHHHRSHHHHGNEIEICVHQIFIIIAATIFAIYLTEMRGLLSERERDPSKHELRPFWQISVAFCISSTWWFFTILSYH